MTNEIETIAQTPAFDVVKTIDGKFKKIMNYSAFSTVVAETREEQVKMFDIMNNSDSEHVVPMKSAVGLLLEIKNFVTSPYESIDEDTGETNKGVTTLIENAEDGKWYATSSKSVYYTLQNITRVFGLPNAENYVPVKVAITSTKQKRGEQINLEVKA